MPLLGDEWSVMISESRVASLEIQESRIAANMYISLSVSDILSHKCCWDSLWAFFQLSLPWPWQWYYTLILARKADSEAVSWEVTVRSMVLKRYTDDQHLSACFQKNVSRHTIFGRTYTNHQRWFFMEDRITRDFHSVHYLFLQCFISLWKVSITFCNGLNYFPP